MKKSAEMDNYEQKLVNVRKLAAIIVCKLSCQNHVMQDSMLNYLNVDPVFSELDKTARVCINSIPARFK